MHCIARRRGARARPCKRARTAECGLHPTCRGRRRLGCAEALYDLQIAAQNSVRCRVTELQGCKARSGAGAPGPAPPARACGRNQRGQKPAAEPQLHAKARVGCEPRSQAGAGAAKATAARQWWASAKRIRSAKRVSENIGAPDSPERGAPRRAPKTRQLSYERDSLALQTQGEWTGTRMCRSHARLRH